MMLNNSCSIPLISDHQTSVRHPLSQRFSPPNSLFLQPIFLLLPSENAVGDDIKIIHKVKVYCIHGPNLLHTGSHIVVESNPCWLLLITFLPITCLWMDPKKTCAMIFPGTKVKLTGLHCSKVPWVPPLALLKDLLLVFLLLSQTSPSHHDLSEVTGNTLWSHIS